MSERHQGEGSPEERTITFPPAATSTVLWHMLRVSVLWLVVGSALIWWLNRGDADPWTGWISGVITMHIAVPAYSLTGLGGRLGRHTMTRGPLMLGWSCMLVLTIGTTLVLALVLRSAEPVSPPFLTLLVCTVFPALVFTACLITLPRLWGLGKSWGAVVSIAIILGALALCLLAVWPLRGGPDWLVPALWIGSGCALGLAIHQARRVPMENMNSITGLW